MSSLGEMMTKGAQVASWALGMVVGFTITGCSGDLKYDTGTIPDELGDGWEIDTPEHVGLSRQALETIHRELLREDRFRGILSLLVVKDGKLVFETYLRTRADQGQFRAVQSATKSVTSLIYGIVAARERISLETTLGEVFPGELGGLEPQKRDITFRHLLTMTSGIDFDNDHFAVEMLVERPDDPLRYMLSKPMYAAPGERFFYRDLDPQLLGHALTELTHRTELEWAEETLFSALGIHDYYWEAMPDGVTTGPFGLHLLPRDLAKIGKLSLQRGMWEGEELVPEAWLEVATQPIIDSDVEYAEGVFPYGYYFWIVPDIGFAMDGHGGQFVLIAPEQNTVVIQTGFPDNDLEDSRLNVFIELVRPLLE